MKNQVTEGNDYITVESVADFLDKIQKLNEAVEKEDNKGKQNLYFRGECSYYENRIPSLYVKYELFKSGSEYYYRTLLSELGRDDYQENASLFRLISELQHYEAKTRMLDVSSNPLIALYMAVVAFDGTVDEKEDGYVYIYRTSVKNEKFDTGHTAAIKSALNFMPQDVINDFLAANESLSPEFRERYEKYDMDKFEKNVKKSTAYFENVSEFMERLNQCARVRERLIYPIKIYNDLNKAHLIIPAKATERIRRQQGFTTVAGCHFNYCNVKRILKNEAYVGDRLFQKFYNEDPITKRSVVNRGELPQYYFKDHHKGIISRDVYEQTLIEYEKRNRENYKTYPFTGKLYCECCGEKYHRCARSATNINWGCRTNKYLRNVSCDSRKYQESDLMMVACKLLKLKAFDADMFSDEVERINVKEDSSLEFILYRGEKLIWPKEWLKYLQPEKRKRGFRQVKSKNVE
ncbi:MAG: FRG domain-containing protein [Lactobacillales bacterium]|jgi:hypothetical protein|nr:FRG domain-containing protein [Lactobacillales bacterium]